MQLGGREIGLLVVGRVGGRRPLRPNHSLPQVELIAAPRVHILARVTHTHRPVLVQVVGLLFSGWTEATRAECRPAAPGTGPETRCWSRSTVSPRTLSNSGLIGTHNDP